MNLLRIHKNRKARELISNIPDERLGLSKTNRKLISEYFRYNEVPGYFVYNSLDNQRDYIQFAHCRFAIDSLLEKEEKAVIYAHIGHLNKKNAIEKFYSQAAGNYLSHYYGNDFFVIGLLTGSGTLSYYESGELVTVKLDNPVSGSLENLCLKAEKKVFYKTTGGVQSYFYRMSGNRPFTKPFYPYNCLGRMDAFIFFDRTSSIKIPKPVKITMREE
jgi:erythromycin esterase-like protein